MPVFNSNRNGKHAHVVHFPFGIVKFRREKKTHSASLRSKREKEKERKKKKISVRAQAILEDSENIPLDKEMLVEKWQKKPTHMYARRALQHICEH